MNKNKFGQILSQYEFGRTLLHFKNYFSATLATKALSFISIPVLTRLLTPKDYGVFNTYSAYVAIFTVVFSLNTYASVGRYAYEEKDDYNSFFGLSIVVSFSILVVSFFILLFIKTSFITLLEIPEQLFYLLFLSVFLKIANSLFNQHFTPLRESKKIALVAMLKSYIGFGVAVVIILLLDDSLYLGPIFGNIIIGLLFLGYFIVQLKPYIGFSLKLSHLKYILSFSVPLIPYALGGIILAQFDRVMVNSMKGSADAGLYSFAYNVGMLLSVFITALFQAWRPDYFKYRNAKNNKKIDKDVSRIFRLVLLAALFLVYYGKEIAIILAAKSFHSAIHIIPLVVFGYVFFSIFNVYGMYIGYMRKTYYNSIILIVSGVLNIYLNALFIPQYGYIASAYTTIVSYLVMAGLSWFIDKYILKQLIPSLKIFIFPLLFFSVFVVPFYLMHLLTENIWLGILIKGTLLGLFVLVLFYENIKPSIIQFVQKQ